MSGDTLVLHQLLLFNTCRDVVRNQQEKLYYTLVFDKKTQLKQENFLLFIFILARLLVDAVFKNNNKK